MLFNSFHFLLFFPIVCLIYYVVPYKLRRLWLLAASYYFYACWNPLHLFFLVGATLVTYVCGILIEKSKSENGKRFVQTFYLTVGCLIVFSFLFYFKYSDFIINNLQRIINILHIRLDLGHPSPSLPIGISFYTFQAAGYLFDVYRSNSEAEKNLIKYATFIAFFPQLVAGPIERFSNLASQLSQKHTFNYDAVKQSLLTMLWGFFIKVVIADRIAILVDRVFGNLDSLSGAYIVLAVVLFGFQIYCDFNGYTLIAIGAAGVMGFRLMDNFKTPYCSVSVKEFWSRWHLSLTNWFRDYLYIPLGGNRKGKIRTYINLIIVFLVSGLWHGASWSFVFWGGINGLYLVIGDITGAFRGKLKKAVRLKDNCLFCRVLGGIFTFALIDFSWLFFRSGSLGISKVALKRIVTAFDGATLFDGGIFNLGLDPKNFIVMIVALIILLVVDVCQKRGFSFKKWLMERNIVLRFCLPLLMIMAILVFGIYGSQYEAAAFIYFQF